MQGSLKFDELPESILLDYVGKYLGLENLSYHEHIDREIPNLGRLDSWQGIPTPTL